MIFSIGMRKATWMFARQLGDNSVSYGSFIALMELAKQIKDGTYTPDFPVDPKLVDAMLAQSWDKQVNN